MRLSIIISNLNYNFLNKLIEIFKMNYKKLIFILLNTMVLSFFVVKSYYQEIEMERYVKRKIGFKSGYSLNINKNYAWAEGTWVFLKGDQHAFPVNYSLIECWKDRGICRETTVELQQNDGYHDTDYINFKRYSFTL